MTKKGSHKQYRYSIQFLDYGESGDGYQSMAESKQYFLEVINRLQQQGAQGIILGCTEIPLLIKQDDIMLPLFNTTKIHAEAAVDYALS